MFRQKLQIYQWLRFLDEAIVCDPLQVCSVSGKISYSRRKSAVRICEWIANQYGDIEIKPYPCWFNNPKDGCGKWHIGHSSRTKYKQLQHG